MSSVPCTRSNCLAIGFSPRRDRRISRSLLDCQGEHVAGAAQKGQEKGPHGGACGPKRSTERYLPAPAPAALEGAATGAGFAPLRCGVACAGCVDEAPPAVAVAPGRIGDG